MKQYSTPEHPAEKARVIAFYLPQYHPIPENDAWWEPGFTEWTNVGKARALYPGHRQPKLPTELGYYDLRVPETRAAQAALAREYGIEGFCYWHYWFGGGKRLLERPFDEVLQSGEPDFPFCLGWANESWKGFYHGLKTKQALIEQTYPGDDDHRAHFHSVLPAFQDRRYITVDGKPLFLIYQPFDNREQVMCMMSIWRELAAKNGLPGIWFVAQTCDIAKNRSELEAMGFDAINVIRLFEYERRQRWLFRYARWKHRIFRIPFVVPYADVSRYFVGEEEYDERIIPTIFPNWDHTPRTGKRGLVLHNPAPKYVARHMEEVARRIAGKPQEHRLVFVKSWNEWAEGNYVEPDREYGRSTLELLRKYFG